MTLSPEAVQLGKELHDHLLTSLRTKSAPVTADSIVAFLEERTSVLREQSHGLSAAIFTENQWISDHPEGDGPEEDLHHQMFMALYAADEILDQRQDAEQARHDAAFEAEMASLDMIVAAQLGTDDPDSGDQ